MEKARTLRAATTCTAWLALLIEMILAVGSSSEQTTQQKQEVVKTIAGGTISGYENAVGTHAKFDAPIAVAVLRDARPGATKDDQSVLVAANTLFFPAPYLPKAASNSLGSTFPSSLVSIAPCAFSGVYYINVASE